VNDFHIVKENYITVSHIYFAVYHINVIVVYPKSIIIEMSTGKNKLEG